MKFYYWPPKCIVVRIGPWACCYQWVRAARYPNGSRWCSGWFNWRRDAERSEA